MKTEKISGGWGKWGGTGTCRLARVPGATPLLVGGCALLATLGLWQAASFQERTQIEGKVKLATEAVKNEVQGQLAARTGGLQQIAARWEKRGQPTVGQGKIGAEVYIDFYPNCQTVQWVDASFQPRWTVSQLGIVAPGGESHRLLLAPKSGKWKDIIAVPSFSEQGSRELWVYVPLYYKGSFDGFLFASFRTEGLFQTILNDEIVPGYGLSVFEGQIKIFSRDSFHRQNADAWGQETSFPLDGIRLRVRVWPNAELLAEEQSPVPELVLAAGLLVSACLTFAVRQALCAKARAQEVEAINVALNREISERKEASAALRQHMEMIDFASDAIVIRSLDDRIVYWNQGAERLYGWKKEEVAGKYIDTFLQTVFPQPIEEVLELCRHQGHWEGELIHTKRDGTRLPVGSRWTLQRDETGSPNAILQINSDISLRKQAEAERAQLLALEQAARASAEASEQRYRTLAETIPQLVWSSLPDGRHDYFNQRWVEYTGMTLEQTEGWGWQPVLHPDDWQGCFDLWTQALRTGETYQVEYRLKRADGQYRWHLGRALPIRDREGQIVKWFGTCTDIDGQKRAEEERALSLAREREARKELEDALLELQRTQSRLIQSEKMSSLGQLVAGVAHEINNPVNFIFGNLSHAKDYTEDLLRLLELYQEIYPNPAPEIQQEKEAIDLEFLMEDLPKLLSSMKLGADRIRDIVLSLRNFSRLDEASMKEVDIHEGIDSTLLILQNRLKAKPEHPGIGVVKEYGNLPKVECYAGQMNQVFMNILSNAIDALDEWHDQQPASEIKASPSTITIRTEVGNGALGMGHGGEEKLPAPSAQFARIAIADSGPGMTELVSRNLFNPFFTTKPAGKGTGLGLAISYEIVVEKHGGSLRCVSAPGKGAEFVIEIPLRQPNRG
ncbi:MAG: PAS domain S-box protein [Oscillatoria princeps RMCB-10]|nr:PAS domain S-box protein [Oscillatoria princeps RMCB-10]